MDKDKVYSITKWVCPECSTEYGVKDGASLCMNDCRKAALATKMLEEDMTLGQIQDALNLWSKLADDKRHVTKNHCFKMSWLQCCDYPAYRIVEITKYFKLRLWGIGGWTGGYGTTESVDKLPKAHVPAELYIAKRRG